LGRNGHNFERIDVDVSMDLNSASMRSQIFPDVGKPAATARLLGLAEHDIPILMAGGKLTPLGDPAPNAPKWFAAVEMVSLTPCPGKNHWSEPPGKSLKPCAKNWDSCRKKTENAC
jgi:hypothetical protein